MHTYLIAPITGGSGLTSTSVGLVRALDRIGLRVGFFKPIGQSHSELGTDLSTSYVQSISSLSPPEPISLTETERYLADGQMELLLEKIAENHHQASENVDVLIVEGLQPSTHNQFLNQLNPRIAQALNCEIILLSNASGPADKNLDHGAIGAHLQRRIEAAYRIYGGDQSNRVVGLIINQGRDASSLTNEEIHTLCPAIKDHDLKLIGTIPFDKSLTYPRTFDFLHHLKPEIYHEGDIKQRRVTDIHLCARGLSHITHVFQAGALIVTPADRSDIIVATSHAALNGTAIAGLVLTGDMDPQPEILDFCVPGFESGLPVLGVSTSSFDTARSLSQLDSEVPSDDSERLEALVNHVARHLDTDWLKDQCEVPSKPRLSPPAFRHHISKLARSKPQRIVLPEGDEPRTLQAANICAERGLAIPVLLGEPKEIHAAAKHIGIQLSSSIEIVRPRDVLKNYVATFMEKRKHKKVTEEQAISQLEDRITLGTMMLAESHVDGLVSGAVHSTADTVRPALQLIKTAPGADIVSSIFFMCLPEQVLVYGDCAVNLDPTEDQLADIAIQSASTAQAFGIEPRVAMISYSTHDSGSGANVDKVRHATAKVKERAKNLLVDGPLQYDAASNESVARTKAPTSQIKGEATVFIFPDLNTGNTTYKAVQRAGNVISMGPVLQGLAKPVNDLSRGASIEDIVFTIAITSIQAQQL